MKLKFQRPWVKQHKAKPFKYCLWLLCHTTAEMNSFKGGCMAYEASSIYYLAFHRNHLLTPALDQGLLLSISLISLMAFVLYFGGRSWLSPALVAPAVPSTWRALPSLLSTCSSPAGIPDFCGWVSFPSQLMPLSPSQDYTCWGEDLFTYVLPPDSMHHFPNWWKSV